MSSTILYRFRASSTFEALPLPGSAARLFDVKKAIVKANKLDAGSMEFDLAVRNADTNEEYANESMLLPRGTRLIVQRLPAARGHGFLARMARNEHYAGGGGVGGANASQLQQQQQQHPSGYYTIDSRARDDDEFVSSSCQTAAEAGGESNEDKELAALQAVTTTVQTSGPTISGSAMAGRRGPHQPAGMGPPVGHKPNFHKPMTQSRPNADPELREQEQQPKKRMTGIPRTFLSLSAPPQTDGVKVEGDQQQQQQQTSMLQPNQIVFEELINRGGGQSETSARAKSLDYALSITSTTVPEHLQCAICHNVVKNAMLLPWDPEGRTVCESCIRDVLTQNGFRCPLTGIDGVSPDDLIPNVGLRKAADLFVKGVMEKLQEIENQQVEDTATAVEEINARSSENNILDGGGVEKGVIVSKRMSLSSRKKSDDDDPFGGGDLFGGDVFAVAKSQKFSEEDDSGKSKIADSKKDDAAKNGASDDTNASNGAKEAESNDSTKEGTTTQPTVEAPSSKDTTEPDEANQSTGKDTSMSTDPSNSTYSKNNTNDNANGGEATTTATSAAIKPLESPASSTTSHRRGYRRRGPPAGYTMGAAGGVVGSARVTVNHSQPSVTNYGPGPFERDSGRGGFPPRGGRPGRHFDNRGGGYGRGPSSRGGFGRFNDDRSYPPNQNDDMSRGTKRSFDEQMDHLPQEGIPNGVGRWDQQGHDDRGRGRFHHDGRGGFRGNGRGGGRWGGPPRGGVGFRGRGRGRY